MKLLVIRGKAELDVKSGASIRVIKEDKDKEIPLRDVEAVLVIGEKVKINAGTVPFLASHNIPLTILAKGNISIFYDPIVTRYNNYRRMQYQLSKAIALRIAQKYIEAKMQGMTNMLKYYKENPPNLTSSPQQLSDIQVYERELRIWEATNSNILWSFIFNLIAEPHKSVLKEQYGVSGRKPKHPDPFNKALSVMYAVLYSLATKALLAAGLDPTYGFLHRTMYSTPLTFDYVEQFKPVAIQATIDMINKTGLPQIAEDGELTRESVNESIKWLYSYLTLKHTKTRKTIYQYIFLKAYCLAKYLEGKCPENKLAIVWDRRSYT